MRGLPVMAGDKQVGTLGSTAQGRGLALLRLDRVADALAAGTPLTAGGIAIRAVKPDWATFRLAGRGESRDMSAVDLLHPDGLHALPVAEAGPALRRLS